MAQTYTEIYYEWDEPDGSVQRLYVDGRYGISLRMNGYAPGIHQLYAGTAGGLGAHAPVEETLLYDIKSNDSAEECSLRHAALLDVLARANTGTGNVRFCYKLVGSLLADAPFGYLVGGTSGGVSDVQANDAAEPTSFTERMQNFRIDGVKVNQKRKIWNLGSEDAFGQTSVVPFIRPIKFEQSLTTFAPLRLVLPTDMSGELFEGSYPPMFIGVTRTTAALQLWKAKDAVVSGPWDRPDRSSANAYGGQTLRYTAPANEDLTELRYDATLNTNAAFIANKNKTVAVYGIANPTAPCTVATLGIGSSGRAVTEYVYRDLMPYTGEPIVWLGTLYANEPIGGISFSLLMQNAGDQVEFDAIWLVGMDDVTSRAIITGSVSRFMAGLDPNQTITVETPPWWVANQTGITLTQGMTASEETLPPFPLDTSGRSDLLSSGDEVGLLMYIAGKNGITHVQLQANRQITSVVPR